MSVAQILKTKGNNVVSASPDDTVEAAAKTLAERRIGAIMVLGKKGEIAGILSERDVVRALAEHGRDVLAHPVSRHMTAKVTTATEADTVRSLLGVMTQGKFRHLPIVEDGKLIGIVSIGDIVKFRLAETEAEAQALREYITA